MLKPVHISLDAMGGDNAPDIVINGAAQSKVRYPNLRFTFFGDETQINPLIKILNVNNLHYLNDIVKSL